MITEAARFKTKDSKFFVFPFETIETLPLLLLSPRQNKRYNRLDFSLSLSSKLKSSKGDVNDEVVKNFFGELLDLWVWEGEGRKKERKKGTCWHVVVGRETGGLGPRALPAPVDLSNASSSSRRLSDIGDRGG